MNEVQNKLEPVNTSTTEQLLAKYNEVKESLWDNLRKEIFQLKTTAEKGTFWDTFDVTAGEITPFVNLLSEAKSNDLLTGSPFKMDAFLILNNVMKQLKTSTDETARTIFGTYGPDYFKLLKSHNELLQNLYEPSAKKATKIWSAQRLQINYKRSFVIATLMRVLDKYRSVGEQDLPSYIAKIAGRNMINALANDATRKDAPLKSLPTGEGGDVSNTPYDKATNEHPDINNMVELSAKRIGNIKKIRDIMIKGKAKVAARKFNDLNVGQMEDYLDIFLEKINKYPSLQQLVNKIYHSTTTITSEEIKEFRNFLLKVYQITVGETADTSEVDIVKELQDIASLSGEYAKVAKTMTTKNILITKKIGEILLNAQTTGTKPTAGNFSKMSVGEPGMERVIDKNQFANVKKAIGAQFLANTGIDFDSLFSSKNDR